MAQNSLRIVARAKVWPDKASEFRSRLTGLIAPTLQEPGCLRYEVLQNREDPTEFTFVEEWRDEAAIVAHDATDHIKDAHEWLPNLLAEEIDVRRYNVVS